MSERWKYQVKVGLFWGIFMTVFNLLFSNERPISAQIVSQAFYIRLFVFTIGGIFVMGYIMWKQKVKGSDLTWSDIFGKKK
jgi:drug/metabolite transporter superfamily protein YnfA